MAIKGLGHLILIGAVIVTLVVLIDESDAAKKAKPSSKKEQEQAEQSEAEGVEEESAEENVKSSKLYKKKKSQEKFSKKGKKYSKLNAGEAVQDEPVKVKILKKTKVSAYEVYEEEPVEKTVDKKVPNTKFSQKVKVNKIKSEDPTTIKSKKQKKTKYVEKEALPLEEETPNIKIKKAKKMKATKVAEEEEINKNIPAAQSDNAKKYVYIKLPLEDLQLFKEYQQQKQQQQIVEQEKILESVVFEDVRPKKKQTPRGVNIPVPKKREDHEMNKTIQEQVKEVATEVKEDESLEPSTHSAEEPNSTASEQITQDAGQAESKVPVGDALAEEESPADEQGQAADEDQAADNLNKSI